MEDKTYAKLMTDNLREQAIKFVADEKKEGIRLAKAYAKTHKEKMMVSYNEVLDNGDIVTKWWRAANDQ